MTESVWWLSIKLRNVEENWILLGNRNSTNNRNDITTFENDTVILEVSLHEVVKNKCKVYLRMRGSLHYQDRGKNVSQRWQTRLNSCFRDTSTFLLTHIKILRFFNTRIKDDPLCKRQSLLLLLWISSSSSSFFIFYKPFKSPQRMYCHSNNFLSIHF